MSENQIQKITIPIRILTDSGKAVEEAIKSEAEARKATAEKEKRRIKDGVSIDFI